MLQKARPRIVLLGPAFVAAVAYVDPGNVATNISGGATYGYLLVWVIVAANLMAILVQYLSAKLGIVAGKSLPESVAQHSGLTSRLLYWLQAEAVIMATDLAEVVGGAVALNLLFGLPLPVGGVITVVVSLVLLLLRDIRGTRSFEYVVLGLLMIIAVGFLAGLVISPPDASGAISGMVPRFEGADSVALAAGILGATVMPHAIYVHSSLTKERHQGSKSSVRALLKITRIDIVLAMILAGTVNLGMLLLAASTLRGVEGTDTLEGAHGAIAVALGPVAAVLFALALLASGLASTSVGAYAGEVVMAGLLKKRIPTYVRRGIVLVPALLVLSSSADPTQALIFSQVLLSFGIPFALIPLVILTSKSSVMGTYRNTKVVIVLSSAVAGAVVALNIWLLVGVGTQWLA